MIRTNTKNILIVLSLISMMTSCERDLQIYSESAISPEQINNNNIQFFLNGLYRKTTPARDNFVFNDIRGGNYTWTALSGNNSNFGILITGNGLDDSNAFSSSIWNYCYSNIYDANNVIIAAEKLNKISIKAEAHYIRAFLYYNLVSVFGGVPIITQSSDTNFSRESIANVWNLILSDLDFAITNAKDFKSTGNLYVSKQAAKALKARALLALDKKKLAAELAEQVINETSLSVDTNYDRIFRSTKQSSEVIFAYANLVTETNTRMSQLFWPYGTKWAGSYFVQPSTEVVTSLYETNDYRKDVNIMTILNSDGSSNTIVNKYWDVQPIIISRISEMYLIAAEGKGLSQEGLNDINEIRRKRNVSLYELKDIANAEDYLNKILLERRKEFYSEGLLFYDLVRTDKAKNLSNIGSKNKYLMPIPGAQIRLSEGILTQNPSY